MRKRYYFAPCDRYKFDFNLCKPSKGYAQVDTRSDNWYYGNWVCPERRVMVAYVEGDVYVTRCATDAEFRTEFSTLLASLDDSSGLKGIDCGLGENGSKMSRRLEELGFDGDRWVATGVPEYWVSPMPPLKLLNKETL